MSVTIVADIGSNHCGKKERALEAIKVAKDIGVDIIKFQLFEGPLYTQYGNVELPPEWWGELYDYASKIHMKITTSVFNMDAVLMLADFQVPFVKFAYSQKHQKQWMHLVHRRKQTVIVSCDVLSAPQVPLYAKKLYCIPEYPVKYGVDFTNLFTPQPIGRTTFYGFSDHTFGTVQSIRAIEMGAKMIEKHMTLNHDDIACQDHLFSLNPKEMNAFIKEAKKL